MVGHQRLWERVVELLAVGAHRRALVAVLLPEGGLLRVDGLEAWRRDGHRALHAETFLVLGVFRI